MSADNGQALEQTLARVQALITALDELRDSNARESARALIEVVLDLHAQGLDRLLEIIAAGENSDLLITRLAADPQVSGLLLLHGLHPECLETRVHRALERLHAHLGVVGVRVEAMEIAGQGVHVRVERRANAASANILRRQIEDAIFEAAPDVADIQIDGLDAAVVFVPLTSLKRNSAPQHSETADHRYVGKL